MLYEDALAKFEAAADCNVRTTADYFLILRVAEELQLRYALEVSFALELATSIHISIKTQLKHGQVEKLGEAVAKTIHTTYTSMLADGFDLPSIVRFISHRIKVEIDK